MSKLKKITGTACISYKFGNVPSSAFSWANLSQIFTGLPQKRG